ncbi:MAG TPA: SAM-dependent methyltransferase [Opitutus sp.]|nr:SAM-dependent methyltransferase [Opitutus sp.]
MSDQPPVSDEFRALFHAAAHASSGVLPFDKFMELALYHPEVGYYRRDRPRIGYGGGTDFFTASTSGAVFGELVAAACTSLVGAEHASSYHFVEIGAETEAGVLAGVAHPFASARTIRVDAEVAQLSGRCIVFSNELFDAQPFRRFIFHDNAWREIGVTFRGERLVETELPPTEPPADFPSSAPERYVIDAPFAAGGLARRIAEEPWHGLFVAFDYGKRWTEIAHECPAGTARAYYRHTQSNDLLARPGEQDLTCHICWDWLADALVQLGFSTPTVESQEAFFIRRAAEFIAAASTADAAHFSRRKLSLLQLLHPSHLGQKFQVLHAQRSPAPSS